MKGARYFPPASVRAIDRYLATLEHEELYVRRGRRSGLFCVVAVHSTVRGPSLGGCRMWAYDDARAGVRDALRLSRAMTFKSAVAGLPLGGGKGVVMLPPDGPLDDARRRDALLDFGDAVAQLDGRYVTAEDVGTSAEAMEVIAQVTSHVSGLAVQRGGSGDPSPFTALGVLAGVEATLEQAHGSADVAGRRIAVVGLGHVGLRLAELLAERGAQLVVADIREERRTDAERLGATWMAPEDALTAEVDLLAPCALGGVLDHELVPRLRTRAIAGAANNQLADESIADLLHARGVLWAPDFVVNAGGITNIAVELRPEGYDAGVAVVEVGRIGETLRTVFASAAGGDVTPLTAAMELARRRLVVGP
ncbi:Glu/Leu/Phe/Val dehydrogenase [Conexibacter sp. SYSU D00693]|uniref:Glu/Leu/Phe/Val family dehydrogenase n=1 Tax=Conexibacter sp. SYSU D00693 TaxID=2812560 RepID=UPI00196A2CDE|nr:Glu/Leu/Phe/Val dehydrogenase [Conexibacter sp. SYSU D00693]